MSCTRLIVAPASQHCANPQRPFLTYYLPYLLFTNLVQFGEVSDDREGGLGTIPVQTIRHHCLQRRARM